MMKLGSRKVERMIAASFGIEADRMLRLRGRLDRLRKLGCPAGVNTGKGKAAQYGWPQMIELGVAVAMLDIGLSPETVANFMARDARHVRLAIANLTQAGGAELEEAVTSGKWPIENTLFFQGTAFAIAGIKSDANAEAEPGAAGIMTFAELRSQIAGAQDVGSAIFIVDLGNKLTSWIRLVVSWSKMSVEEVVTDIRNWADNELDCLLGDLDALGS